MNRTYVWLCATAPGTMLLIAGLYAAGRVVAEQRTTSVRARVQVDPATPYQTITGWEAVAQAGQEVVPAYPQIRDSLMAVAANDVGITRLRLSIRSGFENNRDVWQDVRAGKQREFRCSRYTTINDNDDPHSINPAGFHFSQLDQTIEQVVLPLKRRIEARGEKLYINANYVAFMRQCPAGARYDHVTAAEYAEFVLATYLHMRDRYRLVPDAWEIILEPDNTYHWRGRQIGEAIVASARVLEQHGFKPRFIAPSNTRTLNAVRYFDEMMQVPGVGKYLEEFSYHRYRRLAAADIAIIGERAVRYNVKTAMLEHIGSGYQDLHQDLKLGRVSAWQQFALAYPVKKDNGAQYLIIDGLTSGKPGIRIAERTRYLRQYFRYVRPGAVRVAAASSMAQVDPLAFTGPGERFVVVLKTEAPARITISGLPPGQYAGRYTTEKRTDAAIENTFVRNGSLSVDMPAAGVMTIFRSRVR